MVTEVLRQITALMGFVFCGGLVAHAGIFNAVHFVDPGKFALGLEPEMTLTHGASVGLNLKFIQGVSDVINLSGIVGTGSGSRKFRTGVSAVFDIFPDIEGQPGIGFGTQGIYYRLTDTSSFELTAFPYIHKTFVSGANEVEPFIGIPFGLNFTDGQYKAVSTIVLGSMFKSTESVRYSMEFGVAVNNAESYISGGIVYYY
ncbi:MAG: hypothetical protein AABZ06_04780 [Bdellovibrionota bacterium]